jgi:hypothetical protein
MGSKTSLLSKKNIYSSKRERKVILYKIIITSIKREKNKGIKGFSPF